MINTNNTNNNIFTFKKQYNDSKNQDKYNILDKIDINDNLSSFQLTDSLSNFRDSFIERNKKLQLIKEKILTNFKNKDRHNP